MKSKDIFSLRAKLKIMILQNLTTSNEDGATLKSRILCIHFKPLHVKIPCKYVITCIKHEIHITQYKCANTPRCCAANI